MIVFRLCRLKYAGDLSGKGAEKGGGRWNSKGTAMIYAGETRALCTAEIAVHTPLGIVPDQYHLVTISIPDTIKVYDLPMTKLQEGWDSFPHPDGTQQLGDQFIQEGRYAVMKVPSAVVQGEYNYLLSPFHADIKKIKVTGTEPFRFDERLFKK